MDAVAMTGRSDSRATDTREAHRGPKAVAAAETEGKETEGKEAQPSGNADATHDFHA